MSISAFVEPKNRTADLWLRENFKQLDGIFRRLHVWDPADSADAEHPHGLGFSEGTEIESEFGWAEVPCHWSKAHANRTVANLRSAMSELRADLSDFKIDHTGS